MSEEIISQELIDFFNSREGAIWMRKYNGEDVSDPIPTGSDESLPRTELSSVIFVSFTSNFPFKSYDRIKVVNFDLVSDIFYEIGVRLADLVPSVNIDNKFNLILDYIRERGMEYEKSLKLTIMDLKKLLLDDGYNEIEYKFVFPDSYIEWLVYNSDYEKQRIGEKLKMIGGIIPINIPEFLEDYLQENYLQEELICKIRSIMDQDADARYISFVDCPSPRQSLTVSVAKAFPDLKFISYEDGFIYNLFAQAYEKGWGVESSNEKAFQYFQLAAQRNYPFAFYRLGLFYKHGEVVERNYIKAKEYFKKAISAGFKPNKYQPIDID